MKIVQFSLATALWAGSAGATPNADVAARVVRAISQLQPVMQVQGRTYTPEPLHTRMSAAKVPGVSIVFIDHGRIAWTGTFGIADMRTGRAVTPSTRFQAASISKPIAASGALVLAEQGRLELDRPVNTQINNWQLPSSAWLDAPVTPRHLLTHTGGLSVHGFPGYAAGTPLPTTAQILQGATPANNQEVKVETEPGTQWRYSGGGFTVLQMLMSDVGGEAFPALMQRLVLRPLRMKDSSFDQPIVKHHAQLAAGHRGDGTVIAGGHFVHPELAAAGMWTTPTDLARWAIGISRAFAGEKVPPLSPASAQAMMTRGQGQWGLGFRLRGESEWLNFSHGGSNQGFRTDMQMYPLKRQGFIVMTNGDNGRTLIDSLRMAIGREFGWPNSEPDMIPFVQVPRVELEQSVGSYLSKDVRVQVNLEGDRLLAKLPDGKRVELIPQGKDRYVLAEDGMKLEFKRDPTGAITSLLGGGLTLTRAQ